MGWSISIGSNIVASLNEAGRNDIVVNDVLGCDGKWRNLQKRRLADIVIWEDAPLPHIPPITCSVRVRGDIEEPLAPLAYAFADALVPQSAIESQAGAIEDEPSFGVYAKNGG